MWLLLPGAAVVTASIVVNVSALAIGEGGLSSCEASNSTKSHSAGISTRESPTISIQAPSTALSFEDEKKAYGGYCTVLTKWEQDEDVAHTQIISVISDLLLMKIHRCTTMALMWKSLTMNLKGSPTFTLLTYGVG